MKRRRVVYILWFQPQDGGEGWPTANNKEERLPNTFTLRKLANEALKDHNKRWPEDKKEMSVKIFEEVSR